jgi:hypothetical protein
VFLGADRDPVGDYAAEDLADTVEAEPDIDTGTLLFLRVPLRV